MDDDSGQPPEHQCIVCKAPARWQVSVSGRVARKLLGDSKVIPMTIEVWVCAEHVGGDDLAPAGRP